MRSIIIDDGAIIWLMLGMLAFRLSVNIEGKKQKIIFVAVCGGLFFIFSALKSKYFTGDIFAYVDRFESGYDDWKVLFRNIFTQETKDPFFYIFSKAVKALGIGPQGYLAVISACFAVAFSLVVYKYSKGSYFSFLMAVALEYYFFTMTGLRQAMAMSCILMAFICIMEEKPVKFILLVLLGSLFHSSAWVFVFAYPVSKIKLGKAGESILVPVTIAAALVFSRVGIGLISHMAPDYYKSYLDSDTTLSIMGVVIQAAVIYFCIFLQGNLVAREEKYTKIMPLLLIGLFFRVLSVTTFAEMFRISMYFSIFSVILAPGALETQRMENKRLIEFFLLVILLMYFAMASGGSFNRYRFFWNV